MKSFASTALILALLACGCGPGYNDALSSYRAEQGILDDLLERRNLLAEEFEQVRTERSALLYDLAAVRDAQDKADAVNSSATQIDSEYREALRSLDKQIADQQPRVSRAKDILAAARPDG